MPMTRDGWWFAISLAWLILMLGALLIVAFA
jgi:hypothetical protein